ncbi:hypothetical protein DRQ36_05175 [bacterium]|nr:MAG: hypothetical protein DRQ36_05175 [bacterium]
MPRTRKKKKKPDFTESRFEIRLSGSGGQGLITAGVILAEAIAVGDGRNAAHTQSYGPEARGGRTRCDVIVSDGDIYFPEAVRLDLLLSLTQEAANAYTPLLKEKGLLIIDEDAVERKPDRDFIAAPFLKKTKEKIGTVVPANIVCLGFIAEYLGLVTKKSLEKSVLERFPEKFAKSNKAALKLGFELAKAASKRIKSFSIDEEICETEIDRT